MSNGKRFIISEDIIERKRAGKALWESEERFRALFEGIGDGIILHDTNGVIIDANAVSCDRLGYNREELLGMNIRDTVVNGSISPVKKRISETLQGGETLFETIFQARNGKKICCEVNEHVLTIKGAQFIQSVSRDITERKRAEKELRDSLAEKEVLLREVHHRVKNNLAAIIAMLEIQRHAIGDTEAGCALTELACRIKAMSLVHEKLYKSENLSRIDFQDYIEALLSHLRISFGPRGAAVRHNIASGGAEMDIDIAVPCGMIVNELVTNSLKYAFPGGKPRHGADVCEINVSLERDGDAFTLAVADNGIGLPADVNWETTKTIGLRLVRMLGQHQLGGEIEPDRTSGTRFILKFSHINRDREAI